MYKCLTSITPCIRINITFGTKWATISGAYISEFLDLDPIEARKVQKQYFHEYGTTLNGLMLKHDVDAEDYLEKVHQIDLSVIPADPELDQALSGLPGRKLVFTNASKGHAERILEKLGIARHFDAVFDIVSADFVPKPDPAPYDAFIAAYDIDPNCTVYFEDMARKSVSGQRSRYAYRFDSNRS